MNQKKDILSILGIVCLAVIAVMLLFEVSSNWKNGDEVPLAQSFPVVTTVAEATQTVPVNTTQPVTAPATAAQTTGAAVTTDATVTAEAVPLNLMPQTTQEIIDKYVFLVDKFKKEKPAYTKKEYQALPEEYRNFGNSVNFLLKIASNYMVSEEDAQELVKPAGTEDILYDMPIWGTEKGCVLTDYDAVAWAKCEDMGDGTYKLSFSLKEEKNIEPTPSDTLIPVSAHGAVMQPMVFSELQAQVDDIVAGVPGVSLNGFDLFYRDGVFSCIYNPETDEVKSITHNIVIDISADVVIFTARINGTARLLNDMLIYNITW